MHDDSWAKWFRDSFDKLMLFIMFAGQLSLVVWMIRHSLEQGYVNWAQNIASTILGTLLGLITGKLLSKTDQSSTVQVTQSPGGGSQTVTTPIVPKADIVPVDLSKSDVSDADKVKGD